MIHTIKKSRNRELQIITASVLLALAIVFQVKYSAARSNGQYTTPKASGSSSKMVENSAKPASVVAIPPTPAAPAIPQTTAQSSIAQSPPATTVAKTTTKPVSTKSTPKPPTTPTAQAPASTSTPAPSAPVHTVTISSPSQDMSEVQQIIDCINQNRTSAGLSAVSMNSTLNAAAYSKSKDMSDNNYFAHTSPSGVTDFDFISGAGYHYRSVGINIAEGDFGGAKGLVDAWMGSPGHKANILANYGVDIGIGICGKYFTMIIGKQM